MRTFQLKNGSSARGVKAFFPGAASPLITDEPNTDLKVSATNKVLSNEPSLDKTSTQGFDSTKKQALNFKTQSNSSMISETDYHMSVYGNSQYSPMKINNKSGDRIKYSSLQRP